MTSYSFSPSNVAFYPNDLRESVYEPSSTWPQDAIEVSDTVADKYMTASPPSGKKLGADKNGKPTWLDIPPLTPEEIAVQTESERSQLKRTADSEIAWRQDAVDAEIATDDEVTALAAWKKYRVLLMRVDVNDPKWPKVPS